MARMGLKALVFRSLIATSLCLVLGHDAIAQETAKPAATFPNGASSIQETFEDWRLICHAAEPQARCFLTQVINQESGQRVLSLTVNALEVDEKFQGTLILPFGLDLAKGVTLKLDDESLSKVLGFKTCLPAGCAVPVVWTKTEFAAVGAGTSLSVGMQSTEGQPLTVNISLKGFAGAAKRALEIIDG